MAKIVNKSQRVFSIGGIMISPNVPTEVDDSFLDNERVKELMDSGELEKGEGSQSEQPKQETKTAETQPTTEQPRQGPPKPAQNTTKS